MYLKRAHTATAQLTRLYTNFPLHSAIGSRLERNFCGIRAPTRHTNFSYRYMYEC